MQIEDLFFTLYEFFTSPDFLIPANKFLVVVKLISAIFCIILVINIILIGYKSNFYRNYFLPVFHGGFQPALPPGKVKKALKKIDKEVASSSSSSHKLAVIEADKLLDNMLDSAGYPGKTMGERLKAVNKGQISNLDDVWRAHKVRNKIVHDTDYSITQDEAKWCVETIKDALRSLDMLE